MTSGNYKVHVYQFNAPTVTCTVFKKKNSDHIQFCFKLPVCTCTFKSFQNTIILQKKKQLLGGTFLKT